VTEPAEYPARESSVDKPLASGTQAAADATFNAHRNGDAEDVEKRLRAELAEAGVENVPAHWVRTAVTSIEAGEPVVVEVDEPAPGHAAES
jgi:hypothetical protein